MEYLLSKKMEQKQNYDIECLSDCVPKFLNEKQKKNYSQKPSSQFLQTYLKQLGKTKTQEEINQFKYKLRSHGILVDGNQFTDSLEYQIVQTDLQSFTLLLHYGNYKLKVNVLMTELNKDYFTSTLISSGSFGSIYSIRFVQDFYAVKRVMLTQKNFYLDLKNVYKEYFLFIIASILEVGPKIRQPFGYDIIVTRNEAFFAMELCLTQKIQTLQQIEKQSLENIRVMHSLNFVHLDIKPGNLAYSKYFKKCIFLDYGLSQFIEESPGYKTTIGFVGTVSYCSDEMKSTYFFNKKKPVDLYYNDMVSFKTTLKVINERNLCKKQGEAQQYDIFQTKYFEFYRTLNSIEESAQIFRLKFYIFSNNVQKVIENIQNLLYMPKSFFAILNSRTGSKFIENNQNIKNYFSKIQNKIIKEKKSGNIIDGLLSEALDKVNEKEGVSGFKLSQLTLKLSHRQFELLLGSQQFIVNIILYLDHFSKYDKINEDKSKIVSEIITKINEIQGFYKKPIDFFQHITNFLRFLNMSLKKTRTYKMLSILRLLFIKMEDLKPVQPLQDEIISLISDPNLKCLKITEFFLFWEYVIPSIEYYKDNLWLQMIKSLQASQKIKQMSILVTRNKYQRVLQDEISLRETKDAIEECRQKHLDEEIRSEICLIEYMYLWSGRFQGSIATNNFSLRIYMAYVPSLKFSLIRPQAQTSFDYLFLSYTNFVKKLKSFNHLGKRNLKLQNCLNYVLKICEGRLDLVNYQLFYHVRDQIMQKRILLLLFDKFYVSLKSIYCYPKMFISSKLRSFMFVVENTLEFIKINKNSKFLSEDQKLNEQQINDQSQKIRELIKQFQNKKDQFDDIKRTVWNLCKVYQVYRKIVTIGYYQSIQIELTEIYSSFNHYCYLNHSLLGMVSLVMREVVEKPDESINENIQNIIISLCQRHLKLQTPYLLENRWNIFIAYIKINSKRGRNLENRTFIQFTILYAEKTFSKAFVRIMNYKYTAFLIEAFCNQTGYKLLKDIYQEIAFQKCQFQRNYYAFYILFMFQTLYPKWYSQKEVILKQLKRSCLCLERMARLHCFIAKGLILNFCELPFILKNKRKKLICSRLSARSVQIRLDIIKNHMKLLKQEANLIKKGKVRQKLIKKIELNSHC